MGATILMVTHDSFTASYANRIFFLQDGKLFTEIRKGENSRKNFFDKIFHVLTMLGGENGHIPPPVFKEQRRENSTIQSQITTII